MLPSARASSWRSATRGVEHYVGLENLSEGRIARVEMTSDELAAICPITGQPDIYVATMEPRRMPLCLESKSLKLYLATFATRVASARRSP